MASDLEKKDLSGLDRMAWNVISSWTGHLVFVVAGFIMPRMIDWKIGQASLGIWDFSWSLVTYFSFAGMGIGSSVNRYVAKFRAINDVNGLRRATSSVFFIQIIMSIAILLVAFFAAYYLPYFFEIRFLSETRTAQWVVFLLGMSLSVETAFDTFRGVITGCHRWDLHNAVSAGSYAVNVSAMILALNLGGGLLSIASVYLGMVIMTQFIRIILATQVCPELKIRLNYVEKYHIKTMFKFGIKGILVDIPNIFVGQGASVLITKHMGPVALAIFSRPRSLLRNAQSFINKYSFILTPTAGSLNKHNDKKNIYDLLIKTTRMGIFITIPMLLFLSILGNQILNIWMGPRYEQGASLLTILSVGYFLVFLQQPVISILIGLNLHGKIAIISLFTTVGIFIGGVISLDVIGWTLEYAAIILSISLTIGVGIIIPFYGCLKLNIDPIYFIKQIFLAPFLCGLPFFICLLAIRFFFYDKPCIALCLGLISFIVILGPLYWCFVLTENIKIKLYLLLSRKVRSV